MDLKEEDILKDKIYSHWYYVSKGRAMQFFFRDIKIPEVLDVGAGSGIFSRQLIDEGICNSAICIDPNYEVEKTERYNGKQLSFVKDIKKKSNQFILMMDVLEHVADDVELLSYYADTLDTDGYILISVPAFQFIWSGHDTFLEHYRRYTIKTIETIIRRAGMKPLKSCYFFASLFPAIAIIRIIKKILLNRSELKPKSDLKLYPEWINRILIHIHHLERHTFFPLNKAFGLSIFCLCRKN